MEQEVAKMWEEYYKQKGKEVTGSNVIKIGKVDKDGFQEFRVIIFINGGYLYNFSYWHEVKTRI